MDVSVTDRVGDGPLVHALATGHPAARSIEARTSVATTYAPCVLPQALAGAARCTVATPADPSTMQLAGRIASLLRDSITGDALHASALIDLHWGGAAGKSLSRSIQSFGQSTRYGESPATWADLAAAELARADAQDDPRARLAALDAAVRAVTGDSANVIARFNLALSAERLGLDSRAREEWMRYRAMETDADWNTEAQSRVAAIDRRAVPSATGALDAARIRALVARDPSALRLRVLTRELDTWSAATLMHQRSRADSALEVMNAVGSALANVCHDSTVLAIVRELGVLNASTDAAQAAGAFAAGQRASREGRYAVAESLFARSAGATSSPSLAAWSRTYQAIQQVYTDKPVLAMARLYSATTAARAAHRTALEARAGWSLGVMLLRAGRRDEANAVLDRVATISAAIGDRDAVAGVAALRGEDRFAAGDERTAWHLAIDALSTLRGYHASLRLRNALNLLAWSADERGLAAAAAVIRGEDAAVALASGHPEFYAEALLAAARSRLLQGDTARALAALQDVEQGASTLPVSDVSRWLAARAAQLRALAGAPVRPAALDSAVSFFRVQRNGVLLADALVTRAQALASTNAVYAERDLAGALTLVSERASQWRSPAERRALERRIHDIAARLAMSHLARHDDLRALAAVERGRGGSVREGQVPDDGAVVVDYLLAGDTLVTWRYAAGHLSTSRAIVSARRIALARERLVQSAGEGSMDRGASAMLYDVFLRPHEAALLGSQRLVVVADDDLAGIPFSALLDSAGRGTYFAERASVQVVSRMADAASTGVLPAVAHPLFISDPAFDHGAFPDLERLPGARAEVEASRHFYAAPVVIGGASATSSAVSAAMMRADLVHFASHARFDPERPEQSRLVLAPDVVATGGLTARTISGMRLGGVRLAVLSSCESTRSGIADAPLTIGLAKAFHDAGVSAVVGALWRVSDGPTAALMTEFHKQYSRTHEPARALRAAQLALLHDTRTDRHDPAVWGAFVFTGH